MSSDSVAVADMSMRMQLAPRVSLRVVDGEWREDQHRRDSDGRFTSHGAAASHEQGHRDLGVGPAHYRLMREAHDPVSGLRTYSLRRTDTAGAHLHQVSVNPQGHIVRHTLTPPGASSVPQMLSPEQSVRYSGMHRAIQAQAQTPPGRGEEASSSAPAPAPRRVRRAGAPTVAEAQTLRPDLSSYGPGSAPLVNYFRPRLAQIDAALQQPDPLPALQAINVANTRYTRIVTYLSAMIEAHGGEPLVPASRQTRQLRAIAGGRAQQAPPAAPSAPPSNTGHEDFSAKLPPIPPRRFRDTFADPQEVSRLTQKMNGMSPNDLASAVIAGFPPGPRDDHAVYVRGGSFISESQIPMTGGTAQIERNFFPDADPPYVYHALQRLPSSEQGGKIAAKNLASSIAAYRKAGFKQVKVTAGLSVGGYAWARYGFLPSDRDWHGIRESARSRLRFMDAAPEQKQQLENILASRDPKAMWALADHPMGKQFLLGSSWSGTLNLDDPAQYNRCMRYATREERSTAGAAANRSRRA